jgi:hypothetical protein
MRSTYECLFNLITKTIQRETESILHDTEFWRLIQVRTSSSYFAFIPDRLSEFACLARVYEQSGIGICTRPSLSATDLRNRSKFHRFQDVRWY